jgi:hypothetical protein
LGWLKATTACPARVYLPILLVLVCFAPQFPRLLEEQWEGGISIQVLAELVLAENFMKIPEMI